MNLTHKQAQESKRAKDKTTQEIKKLTLERLKLSQTVPLIIRDISSREMHYFLLASEYERAIWTEAINKAQMSSLGSRITEYDIKEGFWKYIRKMFLVLQATLFYTTVNVHM